MTPENPPSAAEVVAMMPFAASLGLEIESASRDEVVGRLAWREDLCTTGGLMHGGVLMSLADTLGAACAFLNLPPGAGTATLSSSTNLMRPVREGVVTGTSRPLRAGRTVIVVATELHDAAGKLVAHTVQSQAVLGP
jgi:1,4-dihydroxy-2-naphthoyl-CoA hydrolase